MTNVEPYYTHVDKRVKQLRNLLEKNSRLKITIAGDHNGSLLGKGFAKHQWLYVYSLYEYQKFITFLNISLLKLTQDYPKRVCFGKVSGKKANKSHYQVWGANAKNWKLQAGSEIPGGGQAAAMGIQKLGVFGIVTTPVAGNP